LFAKCDTCIKAYPSPLILPVSSLHFFMFPSQNLLLQKLCPFAFVNSGDFENLSCVEPRILATTHHCDIIDRHFVNRDAGVDSLSHVVKPLAGALPMLLEILNGSHSIYEWSISHPVCLATGRRRCWRRRRCKTGVLQKRCSR